MLTQSYWCSHCLRSTLRMPIYRVDHEPSCLEIIRSGLLTHVKQYNHISLFYHLQIDTSTKHCDKAVTRKGLTLHQPPLRQTRLEIRRPFHGDAFVIIGRLNGKPPAEWPTMAWNAECQEIQLPLIKYVSLNQYQMSLLFKHSHWANLLISKMSDWRLFLATNITQRRDMWYTFLCSK